VKRSLYRPRCVRVLNIRPPSMMTDSLRELVPDAARNATPEVDAQILGVGPRTVYFAAVIGELNANGTSLKSTEVGIAALAGLAVAARIALDGAPITMRFYALAENRSPGDIRRRLYIALNAAPDRSVLLVICADGPAVERVERWCGVAAYTDKTPPLRIECADALQSHPSVPSEGR